MYYAKPASVMHMYINNLTWRQQETPDKLQELGAVKQLLCVRDALQCNAGVDMPTT
jgi:hypothetical protein